jgi:hypothetical protein
VGWFGPRGLASVVFALLALEEQGQLAAGPADAVITVPGLASVLAHGVPLSRWHDGSARLVPAAGGAEHAGMPDMPDMPERRLIRRHPPPRIEPGADPT